MAKERFAIRFAVYLIPRRGNQVLLSLREGTGWKDGWWSLVAGHVEAGEAAERALAREAAEEAAIIPVDYHHVYTMHRVADDPADEYIDLFFETTAWDGEITNNEPEKCGGLEWFELDGLPEKTLTYVKRVLHEYPDGKTYSSMEKE